MTEARSVTAGFGIPKAAKPAEQARNKLKGSARSGGWSPEEMRQLVKLFGEGKDNAEIAKIMGRSPTAISVKASRFGLKRIPKDSDKNYTMIACLGCREHFPSSGRGNRFCDPCKASDAWSSGGSFSLG